MSKQPDMVELNEKPSLVEITSSYLHEHLPGMTVGTIVITDHQEEERTSLYAIKTSAVTAFIGKGGGLISNKSIRVWSQ